MDVKYLRSQREGKRPWIMFIWTLKYTGMLQHMCGGPVELAMDGYRHPEVERCLQMQGEGNTREVFCELIKGCFERKIERLIIKKCMRILLRLGRKCQLMFSQGFGSILVPKRCVKLTALQDRTQNTQTLHLHHLIHEK